MIELSEPDRHEVVPVSAGQVDIEQYDLAGILVDQEIMDHAELAAAHGPNLPATDVGLPVGEGPFFESAHGNEPLALARVRSDASGVTLFSIHIPSQGRVSCNFVILASCAREDDSFCVIREIRDCSWSVVYR